jgi:hypothetical protein
MAYKIVSIHGFPQIGQEVIIKSGQNEKFVAKLQATGEGLRWIIISTSIPTEKGLQPVILYGQNIVEWHEMPKDELEAAPEGYIPQLTVLDAKTEEKPLQ